jgi:GTP pyrophosphokinase
MMGAKINGVIVPIDKVPQNGDIIEIITSQSSKGPSRDWLKIVKTASARSKIRQWFKKEKRSENIELGRSEVEKEVRKIGKSFTDEEVESVITTIAKRVGIQDADDFYNTIGFGGLSLSRFIPKLKDEFDKIAQAKGVQTQTAEDEISNIKLQTNSARLRSGNGIIIDGERGCQVKFAKCCNPLPGDKIVGFVTRGFGVSVHKTDCPHVEASRRDENNLSRWVKAEWDAADTGSEKSVPTYEATIRLVLEDGIGVIAAISVALADMRVSITSINTQLNKDGTMLVNLSVGCKNTSHYDSIVSKLKSLKSVISVSRGFSK